MSGILYAINPNYRRKSKARRKPRSAAQKAATAKMLAARFGRKNPARHRRHVKHRAAPVKHRRRAIVRYRRNPSRRASVPSLAGIRAGATPLLKAGAIGGAGAVVNDILMGYTARVLPASMATPVDANGTMNLGYFAIKGALSLALGLYGRKIMPAHIAAKMGEGGLTVLAYTLLRPMVPAGISLGYMNPAPTMRPMVANAGRYVSGVGAHLNTRPALPNGSAGRGARAAQVVGLMGRRVA